MVSWLCWHVAVCHCVATFSIFKLFQYFTTRRFEWRVREGDLGKMLPPPYLTLAETVTAAAAASYFMQWRRRRESEKFLHSWSIIFFRRVQPNVDCFNPFQADLYERFKYKVLTCFGVFHAYVLSLCSDVHVQWCSEYLQCAVSVVKHSFRSYLSKYPPNSWRPCRRLLSRRSVFSTTAKHTVQHSGSWGKTLIR